MSSKTASDRKRKSTKIPETDSSADDDPNPKEASNKARKVSTNASVSTSTALQVGKSVATEDAAVANTASAATEEEESIQSVGKMIQDLAHSDNAKVNALLDALDQDLDEDKIKCESFVTAGGCLALVLVLTKYLDKAVDRIPACDQVIELNELGELTTLDKTLRVIISLTFCHDESQVGISTIGCVEAVVKIMKTFPKCADLQERACGALLNLSDCRIGNKKVAERVGIDVLLAAVNNHLNSSEVCENACWALVNIAEKSKENTELLISLGGGAAVAKVRRKWPDDNDVQKQVRNLAKLIAAEMKTWADEDEA
jgi:hypothetical protein